jgi:serine/threonine protein phosphatase PrpC
MAVTSIGTDGTSVPLPVEAGLPDVRLSWAAITDVGLHRQANEDSYLAGVPIFAVADGMGGHHAGDIASDAVVRSLSSLVGDSLTTREAIGSALAESVEALRDVLPEEHQGAGTTVTGAALVVEENETRWAIFNIGDSRVYARVGDEFLQITTDHSIVQQLVDSGQITKDEAEYHPHANVITRAVGLMDAPIPDYVLMPVIPGTRLLICSDGLTKELTDVGINHYMENGGSPKDTVTELLRVALENSGRDNVTAIVVDVESV